MHKELTVMQATRRLGITIDAVYRLIYACRLPARKEDRRWLISADAVEARVKAKQKQPRPRTDLKPAE